MGAVRIRWQGLGKAVAALVTGLVALQALPGLLHAPEPPPLAADVGLPRVRVETSSDRPEPEPPPEPVARKRREGRRPDRSPKRRVALSPGYTGRKRNSASKRPVAPVPAPEPSPAPSSPFAPAAPPPPAELPPSDGSLEFMPH